MVFYDIFIGKTAIVIAAEHGTTIFLPHYNAILVKVVKLKEK